MFELKISNDIDSGFHEQSNNLPHYNKAIHDAFEYKNDSIVIYGLRYKKSKNDYFENNDFLVIVLGKVFYSLAHKLVHNAVTAEEILNQYQNEGISFVNNLKGSFNILLYRKDNNSFLLFNDQLGLKNLYYKSENDKYYISTNLNDFKKIKYEINYTSVLEKIIFTYPISNSSFIKDVFILDQGTIIESYGNKITIRVYFNIENLFKTVKLKDFHVNEFVNLFESCVLQRANVTEKLLVSLTGGFDGRANVAVLLKNNYHFKAYSFGKKGGENTEIPKIVAEKLNLDYEAVYLENDFKEEYNECANSAIYYSDGISIFERANYVYTSRKYSEKYNYNLTGLIGGEVFAPVHLRTDYINDNYYRIIYNHEEVDVKSILNKMGLYNFINPENLLNKDVTNQLFKNIVDRQNKIEKWKNARYSWMYYMKDLITLGFRRFYGNQMHLERYYSENLSPYYDLDLLKYLFSSNHLLTYKNAFKSSLWLRRNNRRLQSLIIKSCFPNIGEIIVDRNYPPNYNLDYRRFLIPFLHWKRKHSKIANYPDFDSKNWCKIYYQDCLKFHRFNEDICKPDILREFIKNYKPDLYNKSFNHYLSILIWCSKEASRNLNE